jgi:Transcriptional regulator
MRIEQFIYLSEIFKHQSISAASQYCYTSPQNISKSICALEKELGTTLFKRTRQGIIMTPDGQKILESAQLIADEISKIQFICSNKKHIQHGIDSITSFSVLTTKPLLSFSSTLLNVLLKENPNMRISLIQAEPPYLNSTEEFLDFVHLKLKTFNVIFTALDEYNFDSFKSVSEEYSIYSLFKEPLCVEISKNHPYANKKSIPIKSIVNIPIGVFGVNNDSVAFCLGALERRYKIKLHPLLISNVMSDVNDTILKEHYAMLRGAYGWNENPYTCLIPLQEKFDMHHAMLLPYSEQYNYLYNNILLPHVRKNFPELYLLNE